MDVMCVVCLKLKERFRAEPIKGRQGVYYRDGEGKRWHGKRCPKCHSDACKKRYFGESVENLKPPVSISRACRKCNKGLPSDRYFKHKACDYAHRAYTQSNGNEETVWTGEEYGGSYCERGDSY